MGNLFIQQTVNQALLRESKHQLILGACVSNCIQMRTTKECLCYHELNACEYFKIKELYIYLLTILQNFFSKLINDTQEPERFFFCILRLYLISLLHVAQYTLFYKKLGLSYLKTQEASTAVITFLTKLSCIEN